MACANSDGTLTVGARRLLAAMEQPARPETIADSAALPLFRVRAGLRELLAAGLATESDLGFQRTPEAVSRLAN
ncbi:MAG: hypothetical protein AB7S39_19740 [Gemmatimonadales bacterium]